MTAPEVPLGQWEFYTVLDDNPDDSIADMAETCCPTSPADTNPCRTCRPKAHGLIGKTT